MLSLLFLLYENKKLIWSYAIKTRHWHHCKDISSTHSLQTIARRRRSDVCGITILVRFCYPVAPLIQTLCTKMRKANLSCWYILEIQNIFAFLNYFSIIGVFIKTILYDFNFRRNLIYLYLSSTICFCVVRVLKFLISNFQKIIYKNSELKGVTGQSE